MEFSMADDPAKLAQRIEVMAIDDGVRAFGAADCRRILREVPELFDRVGAAYDRAIVMGMPLNPASLEQVVDSPTPLYFHA